MTMKIQLSLHCSALKNVAGRFKGTSDPFAVATIVPTDKCSSPEVIGKTEVIKNCLNPHWTKFFILDFDLGRPLSVVISIYDEFRKGQNKSMGSAVFDLGAVLGKKGNTQAKKVKGGGTIFAHVQRYNPSGVLRLTLRGIKLKNTEGFLRKSDPFYEISAQQTGLSTGSWAEVYRSKVVMDNLNPVWEESVIDLGILCGGVTDKPVKIRVYDYEKSGKHVLMGECETTVSGMERIGGSLVLTKRGKPTGEIVVDKCELVVVPEITAQMRPLPTSAPVVMPSAPPLTETRVPVVPALTSRPRQAFGGGSFIDYISGGCEINLCVAIDFTGSNGDPRKPGTLHYRNPDGSLNDYEKAIKAVGSILEEYDSDKKYPVFGFGAKYGGIVRHCFQAGPSAEVEGVDGIIAAYRAVFKSGLIMSGPTVFTEVIQVAADQATKAQEEAFRKGEQAYSVLLILTDGAVSDVRATTEALKAASGAPLSIVIVGIGNADFSSMQFLDDFATGNTRDIAQFVEFNAHRSNTRELTSATLDEIPDQLVGYFQSRNIAPLPAMRRTDSEITVEPEEEEIDLSLDFGDDEKVSASAQGGLFIRPGETHTYRPYSLQSAH